MNKILIIILISLIISSCELIVLGTKPVNSEIQFIEYNQKSALGAIYLFKAELDSNNVSAASQLIAKPDGDYYLAIERYEKFYDMHRIKRMISARDITQVKADTLNQGKMKYKLEFGYRQNLIFTALRINNSWYITDVGSYE